MTVFRRVAAVVASLGLCIGNIAVCAGWQATPEARMACCTNGESCPLHKSHGHDHASTHDHAFNHDHSSTKSQAQADSCCAASAERRDSAAAGSMFAASGAIAVTPAVLFTHAPAPPESSEWRALVPLRVSSVPRHLLLSVFLV